MSNFMEDLLRRAPGGARGARGLGSSWASSEPLTPSFLEFLESWLLGRLWAIDLFSLGERESSPAAAMWAYVPWPTEWSIYWLILRFEELHQYFG